MKLSIGKIHELVAGLSSLEDPEIKLSGDIVLSIAININVLRTFASAYEQARARILANMVTSNQGNNQALEANFMEEDAKLRDGEEEVEIRTIALKALDLDNNPKIRPLTVMRLMPILTGLEDKK